MLYRYDLNSVKAVDAWSTDDAAGDEAEKPAMARALAIRSSIVAEIIVHATPVAPSRDLASMLQVNHAWRKEALLDQRVWRHVHLVQRSVPASHLV